MIVRITGDTVKTKLIKDSLIKYNGEMLADPLKLNDTESKYQLSFGNSSDLNKFLKSLK